MVWAGAAVPLLKDRVSTQPLYAVCFTHINLAILSASLGLAKSGGRRHPFSVVRSRESKPRLQRQVLTTGACVCTGHHEITALQHIPRHARVGEKKPSSFGLHDTYRKRVNRAFGYSFSQLQYILNTGKSMLL